MKADSDLAPVTNEWQFPTGLSGEGEKACSAQLAIPPEQDAQWQLQEGARVGWRKHARDGEEEG